VAELVASLEGGEHWWARRLPEGQTLTLGRCDAQADWAVDWDPAISRVHALLHWKGTRLWVRRHAQAKNPIFFRGEPQDEFTVGLGERFVIGSTIFQVRETHEDTVLVEATPDFAELTCSPEQLRELSWADGAERLQCLAELPELLRSARSPGELHRRVLQVLLRGIPRAEAAALVRVPLEAREEAPSVQVLQWCRGASSGAFVQPSRRLVWAAVQRRQTIMHLWGTSGSQEPAFTVPSHVDWALCAPVKDSPEAGLALYAAGRMGRGGRLAEQRPELFQGDLKFAELVAQIYGSLRRLEDLQKRQAQLAQFFPQPVLSLLLTQDLEEVLRPREVDVTVIFCDLRGSTRLAEQWTEGLSHLWHRISDALAIMSACIADQGGVVGDFHGDAAMGFWGWPVAEPQGAEKAASAALAIYRRFRALSDRVDHPLAGFRCGIGIASGRAIAGRLGTPEQFKVTVYGPPVNLAARLEALTKTFGASILLDASTATRLQTGSATNWAFVRRIGRVRPPGLENPVMIYQLLPAGEAQLLADSEGIRPEDWELAVGALEKGDWTTADQLLQRFRLDPTASYLRSVLRRYGGKPPKDWDGTLPRGL
jgi:adenylate cyclase